MRELLVTHRIVGSAVAAFVLALTACTSRALPPAPQSGGAATARVPSATACASGPGYRFNGPCATATFSAQAGSIALPLNHGYRFTFHWPGNTVAGKYHLTLGDAVLAQIGKSNAGRAFPAYKGAGTAILYSVSISSGSPTFQLKGPLRVVIVSNKGFPGTTCSIKLLYSGTWLDSGISGKPNGNRLVLGLASSGSASLDTGTGYHSYVCR
jgi:hypothetical protein